MFEGGRWPPREGIAAAEELVATVPAERDAAVLEIILNGLITAYSTGRIDGTAVSLQPGVETLDSLDGQVLDYDITLLSGARSGVCAGDRAIPRPSGRGHPDVGP